MSVGYAQLDAQLDRVIEAAIEAAMREEGFAEGSCAEGEFRDTVNLMIDPEVGGEFNPVDLVLTYPAGEWLVDFYGQRTPFAQTSWADVYQPPFIGVGLFNMMRGAIHGAFANWMDLPDPGEFDSPIGTLSRAAGNLNIRGVFVDGQGSETEVEAEGNTDLDILVSYVSGELTQFNGEMIDNLSKYYVNRLRPTITGQYVATCVLGTMMTAEQQIWKATRDDVIALAVEAEKGFKDLANRHSVDLKQLLKVAGVAATAASLFFGATPAGPALAAGGKVITILNGLTPDTPERVEIGLSGGSVDEVVSTLRDSLRTINDTLVSEEDAMAQCGQNAMKEITGNADQFDISRPGDFLTDDTGEYFGPGENLAVLIPHLRVLAGNVQVIGEAQDAEATRIHVTSGSSRWTRWSSLGLGYQGYYDTYESLLTEVDGILSRSAKELWSVAERMVAASYDFQATEDQVTQALGELSKQVEKDLASHT